MNVPSSKDEKLIQSGLFLEVEAAWSQLQRKIYAQWGRKVLLSRLH